MMINNVRLSFPSLFVATAFDADQAKKFSGTFILPADDPQVGAIQKEIQRVAVEKWNTKANDVLVQLKAQNKIALRSGAEKAAMDGFGPEVFFFNASNEKRPGVYDRDRTPLTAEDGRPYAGSYVNVQVEFWAQDNKWGKRINATLRGVQFAADGEPFGGGAPPSSADEFPELAPAEALPADTNEESWMG